jgi:POT family proton-dependent oligopeptide transporter
MIFYLCINLGSLSSIATTNLELHVGFWSAYLLPFLVFLIGFAVIVLGRSQYVMRPPRGSVIVHAFRALWIGLVNKGKMDAAKPSYQDEHGRRYQTPWNDHFIEEIKRALVASKVFLFYPIYWLVYGQMLNNFISQGEYCNTIGQFLRIFFFYTLCHVDYAHALSPAGTMDLHGIPNDLMFNVNPIAIVIFIPILDRLVYPALRKMGIQFKPITRITWGFFMGAASMAYAAIVQHLIYRAPPCYNMPSAESCTSGNRVHVAVQTPAYAFIGLSEILASVTGLEYAFTKAPASMKAFVRCNPLDPLLFLHGPISFLFYFYYSFSSGSNGSIVTKRDYADKRKRSHAYTGHVDFPGHQRIWLGAGHCPVDGGS